MKSRTTWMGSMPCRGSGALTVLLALLSLGPIGFGWVFVGIAAHPVMVTRTSTSNASRFTALPPKPQTRESRRPAPRAAR